MTTRRAITERMKVDCLLHRAFIRCSECWEQIMPGAAIDWDHTHALVHDGPHEFSNLRPLHRDCHRGKTKRDVQANAKVKRIAKGGRKRKGRKLQGRGFQPKPEGYKHRWGKMSERART